MKRLCIALLTLGSIAALPLALHAESPRERREEKKEEEGWVKLGERRVEFKNEKDTIEVGHADGRFSKLRFRVAEGDVEIYKIKIEFAHGDPIEPEMRHIFKEGDRSHDIDLPGEARTVKKVEFYYRSEHRHEPAIIELVGKEAR
jgi:hypothetical protein